MNRVVDAVHCEDIIIEKLSAEVDYAEMRTLLGSHPPAACALTGDFWEG